MTHRHRQFGAAVLATGCALTIAACGSSSKPSSGSSASAGSAGRASPTGLKLTTTQRACLKKHGVTLPSGAGGAGGVRGGGPGGAKGANAKRPTGGTPPRNAKFAKGKRPSSKRGRGAFAGSSTMRTALRDCGVTFSGPSGGGAPGAGTTGG